MGLSDGHGWDKVVPINLVHHNIIILIQPCVVILWQPCYKGPVYKICLDNLSNNKILLSRQFGFRPRLSTEIALAHITDTISNSMDKGLVTGAVFLDLSKAFDTVDHSILLDKLKSCNFYNESVSLFKPYVVSNRTRSLWLTMLFHPPNKFLLEFLKAASRARYYSLFT